MLIEGGEHQTLLSREILVAGLLCEQITKELIAPAKKVRWRAGKLKAAIRLALSRCAHAAPKASRFVQ
jgi:hypothetical protein